MKSKHWMMEIKLIVVVLIIGVGLFADLGEAVHRSPAATATGKAESVTSETDSSENQEALSGPQEEVEESGLQGEASPIVSDVKNGPHRRRHHHNRHTQSTKQDQVNEKHEQKQISQKQINEDGQQEESSLTQEDGLGQNDQSDHTRDINTFDSDLVNTTENVSVNFTAPSSAAIPDDTDEQRREIATTERYSEPPAIEENTYTTSDTQVLDPVSPPYASPSCPKCTRAQQEKQLRMEEVKTNILRRLGLTSVPKVETPIHPLPFDFYTGEDFAMNDKGEEDEEEADEHSVRTREIFIFGKDSKSHLIL